MGRKPIKTRKQILDHLDKLMVRKGLDSEEPQKGALLFKFYMNFPANQRPSISALSDMYKMDRHHIARLIERYDADYKA